MRKQSGFTLIELVVVITILGMLAAFAMPRFAAMQTEARIAKMNAALGSIKSAAALAHSLQLTKDLDANDPVEMEGSNIAMVNGYPAATANAIGHAAGLADASGTANGDDYVLTTAGPAFRVAVDATRNACRVEYTRAVAGAAPTYNSSGLTPANCG